MSAGRRWSHHLRAAARVLRRAGVADPARDARLLAAAAAGVAPGRVTLIAEDRVEPVRAEIFARYVEARAEGWSVARVVGRKSFWGRDFTVTGDTLEPRPETETLIAEALRGPFERVLDLGTGSGCIAVTLLAERPRARGVATDLSPAALAVAASNARAHGVAPRLSLLRADWWAGVEGRFDLVVSNPPYVAEAEMASLAPEVLAEPRLALTPGGDGLGAYRAIADGLARHLVPGGRALLEIGVGQGPAVLAMLRAAGLDEADLRPDMDGRDRVATAVHRPADRRVADRKS